MPEITRGTWPTTHGCGHVGSPTLPSLMQIYVISPDEESFTPFSNSSISRESHCLRLHPLAPQDLCSAPPLLSLACVPSRCELTTIMHHAS